MPAPTRPSLEASFLDPALLGGKQQAERNPVVRPAPAEPPPASAETRPGPDFKDVVRANLHAAAQHAMLGHKAPSFRECPHASCRNASNMVPFPVVLEASVTDADLDEIFQRVVPAALEKAASSPSLMRVEPEWPEEPAFIS
jgi:hypothetical protein